MTRPPTRPPRPGAAVLALLVLTAVPAAAASQSLPAAPFLPQDHWSLSVVRGLLLEDAAAAPGLAGRRSLSRAEVAGVLRAAGAADALARFLEEFPTADVAGGAPSFQAAVEAGGMALTDRLRPGTGYGLHDIPYDPPTPLPDRRGGVWTGAVSLRAGSRAAGVAEGGYVAGDWSLTNAHAALALGPVVLWGGRRPVGFGPGEGGGIVLGDRVVVDGGGVQLARAARAPGFLGVLGPIHFETLLARMGPSGQVENPWLWGARGSITPHPRLTLAVNRGALFGGEGNVDASLRDLLYILIGKHAGGSSEFENQIVSVDARYRPPLPVATELYVEWGFEDSAGAFYEVPGVVWGIAVTGLPRLGGVRLGVERADFARSCCGNPIWYRHIFLHAGWTEEAVPLGHPLAGHGEEWLLYGSGGALEERLQLRAGLALRDRWSENLYAPDRVGPSRAGTLRATLIAGPWALESHLAVEDGDGWTETQMRATVRYTP